MIARLRCRAAAATLLAAALAAPAWSEEAADSKAGSSPEERAAAIEATIKANTDEVKAIVKESADFLAAQSGFSFKAHVGFDVVQLNGQKLEFGASRTVAVRRPDRMRVDAKQRSGERRTIYFDGQNISVDLPDDNAYIVVEKPGSTDAAVDYLVDDLNTPAPLHEFLKSNYFADADSRVRSGYYVEEVTIGKRRCHHMAMRGDEIDIQIWVETGDRPLPCSVIITYKNEEASPQFWANFYDWDMSAKTPDSLFSYTPPADAERLSIQTAIADARDAREVK